MEPLDDDELNQLLRQWVAPSAPEAAISVSAAKASRWQWFWKGSLRVPVPVALAAVIVLACLAMLALYKPAPPLSNLSDFRPVKQRSP